MTNIYEERERLNQRVLDGDHREVIGGLWDEMGVWQFDFCQKLGLKSSDRILDIGCGSLRGGVHFIAYLDTNNYFGTDRHQALLDAGYEKELVAANLQSRLDRRNLICNSEFDFSGLPVEMDFALAQSVFSHLSWNDIRLCLWNLCKVMKAGSSLYATYFEVPEDFDLSSEQLREHGIVTHFESNPYHYRFSDIERATADLPIIAKRLGDVGHPRGQLVIQFKFLGKRQKTETRNLDVDASLALRAGEDHYRAYVGPPRRYDFMSSTQFALLHTMGLREEDRVLDVGCGSLRLGRLLIPFLRKGNYYGIDPNLWLVDEAIEHELGQNAVRLKSPSFSSNDQFDFSEFSVPFDFIIAQSVATHTGPDLRDMLFDGVAKSLARTGVFLFSYIRTDGDVVADNGWHYPACVEYTEADLIQELANRGLKAKGIPWFHPAASWMVAALDERYLPGDSDLAGLSGHVVSREQDTKGYVYRSDDN